MYIATNRFKVKPDCVEAFERRWLNREVFLQNSPGFISFNLLRGASSEGHVLYISHSSWESHQAFIAWTQSDAFRNGHRAAGQGEVLTIGPPIFEGFDVLQRIEGRSTTDKDADA